MKRLLLASTALAIAAPAMAADLRMPVKAAPIAPAPAFSWTGCHIGGHVGADWGRTSISDVPVGNFFGTPFSFFSDAPVPVHTGAAFLGGVQLGCDYQFAAHWVIGAAGDFSWTNLDGHATAADPFFNGKNGGPITLFSKTDWIATATARLGYAWDRWMVYGKGGAAWAHNKESIQNLAFWGNPSAALCVNSAVFVAACNPTGSETRLGWTVGVGAEWAFADHWSAGIEFDHYEFASHTLTLTDPAGFSILGGFIAASGPINLKERIEALKLSLNYRFGGP